MRHIPVLLEETLIALDPKRGEIVCDATLGLGGHSEALLEKTTDGILYGLDADAENLELARKRLERFGERVRFIHANFRAIASLDLPPLDILLADLGVSSVHFDDPKRGFSFRAEGPLDLRFDRTSGLPASEWIALHSEEELMKVLNDFGELRNVKRFSEAVVKGKPQTTTALRVIAEEVLGWRAKSLLPQVFQGLRIAVNDELGALRDFLEAAPLLLKAGGRLGIITFHSLEDRMVKQVFRVLCTPTIDDRMGAIVKQAPFALMTKKAIVPTAQEVEKNPRARSAKLRVVTRRTN